MNTDEVIWQVINQQFCSYKVKYVCILHPPLIRTFIAHSMRYPALSLFFILARAIIQARAWTISYPIISNPALPFIH